MIRFPPGMDRAAVFTRAIELAKGVTSLFPAEIKLEFEKVFEPYLLIGKKTYAGYKYTKVEAPDLIDGVLKPMQKGLASVRGDKIPIVRRLTTQVVSALCDDRLPERAIALLEQNLQLLVDDQIDPADFAIEQKLKKDADDYSASTRHAAVAREMAERDIGTAPKSGEKVVYIIAQHKRTGVTKPMAYEYFLEERADYRVDTVYYIENLIVEALGKLLDVPGLSADPYRIFERFVGMAKSKSMRTDMHRFLTADTSTTAVSTTESNVVVLGNGEMPLSKSKMKRDKDLKKRDRADKAKRLGIKPQAVGKGSLAGFLKEM
jgi:DNA polymerase elongation subunit (family B)